MASEIVDLTGDSSDAGPSHKNTFLTRKPKTTNRDTSRQPLKVIENSAKTEEERPLGVAGALLKAVRTLSQEQLERQICRLASISRENTDLLWEELTVPGKEVVRYHADSDSEDATEAETEEEEIESDTKDSEDSEDHESIRETERKQKMPIAIADEEMTPRYAKCQNCDEEFDITANEKGDCIWHSGEKEVDDESSTWDDHDPDCHGNPYDLMDDSTYAEGYTWSCCDKSGSDEGCKSTKHKTDANIIAPFVLPASPAPILPPQNKKRKAEEAILPPAMFRCANCAQRFDSNNNQTNACIYHPDIKEVDDDGDFWADHDERCHGRIEGFFDDPAFADGFSWKCCGEPGDSKGCVRAAHSLVDERVKRSLYRRVYGP